MFVCVFTSGPLAVDPMVAEARGAFIAALEGEAHRLRRWVGYTCLASDSCDVCDSCDVPTAAMFDVFTGVDFHVVVRL